MSDDPPKLTLSSSISKEEVRKQDAIGRLEWPTREMAANLLRVMRGAGKPEQLPQQIINLAEAILEASKLSNAWGIWDTMERLLQSAVPDRTDIDEFDDFRPLLVRGSLQVCASRLLHQQTHVNRGFDEINTGIRERERIRKDRHERWALEVKTARATDRKPTKITERKNIVKKIAAPRVVTPPAPEPEPPRTTLEALRINSARLKEGKPPL